LAVEAGYEVYLVGLALAVFFGPWLAKGLRAAAGRQARSTSTARRTLADLAPFAGRVWVIDGDTLLVKHTRVRMFGIDAPELSQYGGYKARSHLIRLAGGKDVRVQPVALDCYGRTVARVWCGDVDLSDQMVRDGFARATSRWNSDYDAAESQARRRQCGLWCGNPLDGIRDPAAHRRWRSKIGRL
jgi:endonuclease YncB( thermonuclease family)